MNTLLSINRWRATSLISAMTNQSWIFTDLSNSLDVHSAHSRLVVPIVRNIVARCDLRLHWFSSMNSDYSYVICSSGGSSCGNILRTNDRLAGKHLVGIQVVALWNISIHVHVPESLLIPIPLKHWKIRDREQRLWIKEDAKLLLAEFHCMADDGPGEFEFSLISYTWGKEYSESNYYLCGIISIIYANNNSCPGR